VAEPGGGESRGLVGALLAEERRLLKRVEGVLRFDRAIYREIERDPHAIPQAFAIVIVTAVLAGLGQGSLVGMFLGVGFVIALWIAVTALIWGVARVTVDAPAIDFARLLRCTGYAYLWFALLLLSSLPVLGSVFAWAAVGLALASLVLATREVLEIETARALLICSVALGVPLLALLALGSLAGS
jgi:Yip1-like protein